MNKKYISITEYAKSVGLTRQAIYYQIKFGYVNAEKIAGRWVIIVEKK